MLQMKCCVLTQCHVSLLHGFVMVKMTVRQAGMRAIIAVGVIIIM